MYVEVECTDVHPKAVSLGQMSQTEYFFNLAEFSLRVESPKAMIRYQIRISPLAVETLNSGRFSFL